MKTCQRN